MAKRYDDECLGCDFCVHCGRDKTPYWSCDRCDEDFAPYKLYDFYGEMLCAACLLEEFKTIESED